MSNALLHKILLLLLLNFCGTLSAFATAVSFTSMNLGGNSWQLDFEIKNRENFVFDEITIFFDRSLYGDLSILAAPQGWDSLAVQPDESLSSDGFVDLLSLNTGISPGGNLLGISVRTNYFVAGAPTAQVFQIINPVTFDVIYEGQTTAVPEASTSILLVIGLLGISAWRRFGA